MVISFFKWLRVSETECKRVNSAGENKSMPFVKTSLMPHLKRSVRIFR